jgi:hypothetical protein
LKTTPGVPAPTARPIPDTPTGKPDARRGHSKLSEITNIYQLLAFFVVAGLQIYTRWEVSRLARKQDKMNMQHDISRSEFQRLFSIALNHVAADERIPREELATTIKAALKVSYHQGQADASAGRPFPEERANAAAWQLVDAVVKALSGRMKDEG